MIIEREESPTIDSQKKGNGHPQTGTCRHTSREVGERVVLKKQTGRGSYEGEAKLKYRETCLQTSSFSLSPFPSASIFNNSRVRRGARDTKKGKTRRAIERARRRVLAGFRAVAVRFAATRRRRARFRVMDCWQKVVFPVRRAWIAVAARVRARKNGGGILKLHDDVQTCGYEDVQVMWEMLRRYETSELPQEAKRKRPFWRIFV